MASSSVMRYGYLAEKMPPEAKFRSTSCVIWSYTSLLAYFSLFMFSLQSASSATSSFAYVSSESCTLTGSVCIPSGVRKWQLKSYRY